MRNIFQKQKEFWIKRDPIEILIWTLTAFGPFQSISSDISIFSRQIAFNITGLLVFYILRLDFVRRHLRAIVVPLYSLTVLLLILVLFMPSIKGAHRWFDFGYLSFQPSELAKVAMLLFTSYVIVHISRVYWVSWKLLVISGVGIVVPTILIFVEPDLGSAFIVFISSMILALYHISFTKKQIVVVAILATLGVLTVFLNLRDFQKQRLQSFLSIVKNNEQSISFNSFQARIAIGSGGILGNGLGRGLQAKLSFLPEDHTDFAFASFAEQFGFVGITIFLSVFLITVRTIMTTDGLVQNPLRRVFRRGVLILFVIQSFINISMNLGLIPVVGVPLPFISYGGTSLIVWYLLFGLI